MSELEQGWICFDRIEIDQNGRRLLVGGVDVSIEPKAFAVLCLLARHPGRAFPRDEILDVVWGHRHVTPGVLNRAVTLVRQALGESAESSQYLHTLHGVGYRLDADVRFGAMREDAKGVAGESASAPVKTSPIGLVDLPVEAPTLPAPAGDPALPRHDALQPAAQSSHRFKHSSRLWLLAAVALGMLFGALLWMRQRPSSPPVIAPPTLVVLPLQSLGNADAQDSLAEGLSEELITRLAQINGLRLISRTSAARAVEAKLDLDQLGERLRVTHALEGSLRQSDDQLRIDLRLIEIPGGRTLWAQDYDRKLADVFSIEREIAASVAQALTLKLVATSATDNGDAQWFREYLELRHRMWDPKSLMAHAELVEQLRALVARAPGYARAHGLLARALIQDLRPLPVSVGDRSEAASEAGRALELDPDQIDAHAALASVACRAQDWARCMDEYARALKLDPTDSVLRATHAAWLAALGYVDEASRQVEVGLAADPLNFESGVLRGWLIDLLGRHDEAKHWLDAANPAPTALRWYNAVWRRDYAGAQELAQNAMPPSDKYRESYLAASEALIDPARWPQVRPRLEGTLAILLDPDADTVASMRIVESVWVTRTTPLGLMLWSPEFVALHQSSAFQAFLERRHIIDYWRSRGWPPACKPDGDHARCH